MNLEDANLKEMIWAKLVMKSPFQVKIRVDKLLLILLASCKRNQACRDDDEKRMKLY